MAEAGSLRKMRQQWKPARAEQNKENGESETEGPIVRKSFATYHEYLKNRGEGDQTPVGKQMKARVCVPVHARTCDDGPSASLGCRPRLSRGWK